MKNETIEPGKEYIFKKSGSRVTAKEETSYGGKGSWVVARSDTGKEMIVPGAALLPLDHPDYC